MAKREAKKSNSKKEKVKKEFPKEKVVKEEVCEVFNVEKNGKEETIKSCGVEEEKPASLEQMKKEKKIFLNVGLVLLGLVLMFAAFLFFVSLTNHFEVNGVKFTIDKNTIVGVTLYKTSLPVSINGTRADYNFWLRTDPRKVSNINFSGNLVFQKNMVINTTDSLNCNGDGIIATANILNLYKILGIQVMKDENASCDSQGRYMYVNIQKGNQTKVEQFGPECYNIEVTNCEVLPATERFMLETFTDVNQKLTV
jgi:hypothetical protein